MGKLHSASVESLGGIGSGKRKRPSWNKAVYSVTGYRLEATLAEELTNLCAEDSTVIGHGAGGLILEASSRLDAVRRVAIWRCCSLTNHTCCYCESASGCAVTSGSSAFADR